MIESYILDWLNLVIRWVHVITGIAWVGASFYFVWLLNRLLPDENGDTKVAGQLWALHAGGFFHVQKRNIEPGALPTPLHWFKWEAYWTWVSGFALLVLIYYVGAERYLIDPAVSDISASWAIALGLGVLAGGWLLYDLAWRSPLADRPRLLTILCCIALALLAWGLCQVFSGRGAFIHVGALLGTIMVANVARVIMPSQRQLVAATERGEPQDASLARAAGLRSLHNNYITLPVVFVMISSHYPSTYGHASNWLVLLGLFAVGALVRHYFNIRVRLGNYKPAWMLGVALVLMGVIAWFAAPRGGNLSEVPSVHVVSTILQQHCAGCHADNPTYPGFTAPPKGVVIETIAQAQRLAPSIHAQSVATKIMPLGNLTQMTDEERKQLGAWIAAGTPSE